MQVSSTVSSAETVCQLGPSAVPFHSLALWAAALPSLCVDWESREHRRRHAGVLWKTDDSLLAVPPRHHAMMEQSINPLLSVRLFMGVDRRAKSSPAG